MALPPNPKWVVGGSSQGHVPPILFMITPPLLHRGVTTPPMVRV